jgi:hypothetical protein
MLVVKVAPFMYPTIPPEVVSHTKPKLLFGTHVVVVDILKVPITTPEPDGISGAVAEVKIPVPDEKFNFLCDEVYAKLVVPV